jgi:hypothetical protein
VVAVGIIRTADAFVAPTDGLRAILRGTRCFRLPVSDKQENAIGPNNGAAPAIAVFDLVSARLSLLDTLDLPVRSTMGERVQRCTGIKRVVDVAMNLDDALWMSSPLDPDLVRARQELRSLAERLLVIRDTTRREELRTRTRQMAEHGRGLQEPDART